MRRQVEDGSQYSDKEGQAHCSTKRPDDWWTWHNFDEQGQCKREGEKDHGKPCPGISPGRQERTHGGDHFQEEAEAQYGSDVNEGSR